MLNEFGEGEIVVHLFGRRVRLYLGHTSRPDRGRIWHSDLGSHGFYVRPWGQRVIGAQARRTTSSEESP